MFVNRGADAKQTPATGALFTGTVNRVPLMDESQSSRVRAGLVKFEAGGRNIFHTHTFDQVLHITEGEGIVATEAGEVRVKAGDTVVIPAGEKHWHGATPTTAMSHITISTPGETTIVE